MSIGEELLEAELIARGYTKKSPGIYLHPDGYLTDNRGTPLARRGLHHTELYHSRPPLIKTAGPTIRPHQYAQRLPSSFVPNANIEYNAGTYNYKSNKFTQGTPKTPDQTRGGYTQLPVTNPRTEVVYRTPMITVTRNLDEPPIPADMNKPSGMVTHNPFQKREFQPGPLQVFDGKRAGAVYASKPRPLEPERVPQQKKTPIITKKEDDMIVDPGLFLPGVQTGLLPEENFLEPHSNLQNNILNTQHQDIINEMQSQPPPSSAPPNAPIPQTPLVLDPQQHQDYQNIASQWVGNKGVEVKTKPYVYYHERTNYGSSPYPKPYGSSSSRIKQRMSSEVEKNIINTQKLARQQYLQNLPTTQPTVKQSNLDAVSKLQQDQQMAQHIQNN